MFLAGFIVGLIVGFIGLIAFALVIYDRRMCEQDDNEQN